MNTIPMRSNSGLRVTTLFIIARRQAQHPILGNKQIIIGLLVELTRLLTRSGTDHDTLTFSPILFFGLPVLFVNLLHFGLTWI